MAHDAPPPDYYAILEVAETATAQQIRDAYKRAALKNHPDRVPADSPERQGRTRKFQLVNDAYFTLSDAARRREYDAQRRLFHRRGGGSYSFPEEGDETDEADEADATTGASAQGGSGRSWAWDFFSKATGHGDANPEEARQKTEDAQFADVFEEMLREEDLADPVHSRPTGKFWSLLGGASGAALGFIVANVPGMVAGAVAGNRLGAIRDTKGKSVYAVFQELPQDDRARLLSQLAVRVFSHAVGV